MLQLASQGSTGPRSLLSYSRRPSPLRITRCGWPHLPKMTAYAASSKTDVSGSRGSLAHRLWLTCSLAHAKAAVYAWAVDSGVPGRRESSLFDLHEVVRQVDWDANIAMIADVESERQMKKL